MRGPKPILDNVIPMKGDAAPRPVPPALDWMSDEGRAAWEELAPVMVAKDRLEPHYADLFAAYCEAVGDFMRFTGDLAMMGSYYEVSTRNGLQEKKRAAWGQRQEALANMQRIGALFGMSPVDERRLSGGGQGDLFEDLKRQLASDASV
ncbi:P27 family phage terminase small subunit [Pseudoroseicyclus aestuarii]|uniref:P27 family predicted phage terminase small subunit n=1 Tax=Pseudoroseicyclus aestuarii TaxID=1795041 RepID=A0A318SMB5_9RHOB|nr:P27 family phage terminase small subunit [Pseudoroseicyclus aestuarii]PYE80825.1 P27 family predicted phage terminase small subunit [Pseudoroseicyclus aestuarii]